MEKKIATRVHENFKNANFERPYMVSNGHVPSCQSCCGWINSSDAKKKTYIYISVIII